jgi:hypothetical protein
LSWGGYTTSEVGYWKIRAPRRAIGLGLSAIPALAQSVRTNVSGRAKTAATSPCQTLQGAPTRTTAGGQIYALDSANHEYVSISQAVTIVSGCGATGALTTSSVTGITINASANDVINLHVAYRL